MRASLRDAPALLSGRTEVIIESFKYCLPLFVPVVDLDLLVVVCNKLLHVYTSCFRNTEHDFALSLDGLIRKLPLLKFECSTLLSLLFAHFILLLACTLERFEIR